MSEADFTGALGRASAAIGGLATAVSQVQRDVERRERDVERRERAVDELERRIAALQTELERVRADSDPREYRRGYHVGWNAARRGEDEDADGALARRRVRAVR